MYEHHAPSHHRYQYPDYLCAVPCMETLRRVVAVLVLFMAGKAMDTLIPSRYRKPPSAYSAICDFCDFTRSQQQELWRALTRARTPR